MSEGLKGPAGWPSLPEVNLDDHSLMVTEGHIHECQGGLHLLKTAEIRGTQEDGHEQKKERHLQVYLGAIATKYGVSWLPYLLKYYDLEVSYKGTKTKK